MYYMKKNILYTFIFGMALSLKCEAFLISEEDAKIINNKLEKGKRVKITCEGIKNKKNNSSSEKITSENITFQKNIHIDWAGNGVLEVEAKGSIIFEEGSLIKNEGKGGLKLVSEAGTIDFKSSGFQVDFEKSTGAISIFYNPLGILTEKYKNANNFEEHNIKRNVDKTCYGSFMIVQTLEDLKNIATNPQGSYVLYCNSNSLTIPYRIFQNMNEPFKGVFNFNNRHFTSSSYQDHSYNQMKKTFFYQWCKHPCIISHVFKDCLEGNWGENTLYMAPPLDETESNLLTFLEQDNENAAIQSIKKIFSQNNELDAGRLAFYNGVEKNTPLHIAAMYGRTIPLKQMLFNTFQNNLSDQSDPNYTSKELNFFLLRNAFSLLERKNNHGKRAIDLAVQNGHIETVSAMLDYYQNYNMYSLGKDLLLTLAQPQEEILPQNSERMIMLLKNFKIFPLKFGRFFEGSPVKKEATQEEYDRQYKVGLKFFCRKPGTNRTYTILNDFIDRYMKKANFIKYTLEGVPSRSRIILLQAITNEKLKTFFSEKLSEKQAYWREEKRLSTDNIPYMQWVDLFPVTYLFDDGLEHVIENQPTQQKPGHAYYERMGKYEEICEKVAKIEKSISIKKIAKLSHRSRVSGKSITAQMLWDKGYKNREGGDSQEDAHYLNKVNFLLDLEVVFRLVSNSLSPSSFDMLPIAGANSRAFSLHRRESFSLNDLLNKASCYHPFTDTKGASQREEAIKAINNKFHEEIKEERGNGISQELVRSIIKWKEKHPKGRIIKTMEGLHQELLEEYGGGYESSGEDY